MALAQQAWSTCSRGGGSIASPRFWREFPSRYNLLASKCGNCGRVYLPTRMMCPKCHRESLGKMKHAYLGGEGEVVTYTVIHTAQQGFDMQVPYVMAIIKLKEGLKLTGQIVDCDPEEVKIGMKVRSVLRRISEDGAAGTIHYGYKFMPIWEE